MRRSAVFVFLAGIALACTACSLLTSLDGLSGGSDGGSGSTDATSDVATSGDASPGADGGTDASDDAPSRDAGDDAGAPSIHPQGTFEGGTCAPWAGYQGSVTASTLAHTGSFSCRVCTAPTTTDFFTADDNGASGPGTVGATYRAEAWVRTDPSQPAPSEINVFLRSFRVDDNGVFLALESASSPDTTIGAQWKYIETTLQLTKPNGRLNVFVGAPHSPGACFLLDDVALRRID